MKQKIKIFIAFSLFLTFLTTYPLQVYAKAPAENGVNTNVPSTVKINSTGNATASCDTSILTCMKIEDLIAFIINILTAGVGIVAVGALVYAGILYTTAAGNPDQTKKAITMITNIVIGIIAYALMYLVLNFIVPGGITP